MNKYYGLLGVSFFESNIALAVPKLEGVFLFSKKK